MMKKVFGSVAALALALAAGFANATTLDVSIVGTGETTPAAGQADYTQGSVVDLTATTVAGSGYAFNKWSGDLDSIDPFESITLDADKSVTAEFVTPGDFSLTIAKTGPASGFASTFPAPGVHAFLTGRTATVAASPGTAFFKGWSGALTSTAPVVTLVMDANKSLSGRFESTGHVLTLNGSPGGDTRPSPGTYPYATGVAVTLEAFTTQIGYNFVNWTGDIGNEVPTQSLIAVVLDADRTVTANFVPDGKDWTLYVNLVGTGGTEPSAGIVRCSNNETVNLLAIGVPGSNYAFQGWTGDVSTTDLSTSIVMNGDKTVNAVFVSPADVTLNISSVGPGTTTPAAGAQGYLLGRVAHLVATPNPSRYFAGWTGDVTSVSPVIDVTMDSNKTIAANFGTTGHTLALTKYGNGTTDPPIGNYSIASEVTATITAIPDPGQRFVRWEGTLDTQDPLSPVLNVSMEINRTLKAFFVPAANYFVRTKVSGPGNTFPAAGDYDFPGGSSIYLAALPKPGNVFTGWSGGVTAEQSHLKQFFLEVTQDTEVTASFAQGQTVLTLNVEGDGTTDPVPGAYTYLNTENASVTAVENVGSPYKFDHWEGDIGAADPQSATISLFMNTNRTVTAVFTPEGEGEIAFLTVDQDFNNKISLGELLRVIQFYNAGGLHCQEGTEDGYGTGQFGDQTCAPYATDYSPQDWIITLNELLRAIQFYNSLSYHYCPGDGTEDGFCPGA